MPDHLHDNPDDPRVYVISGDALELQGQVQSAPQPEKKKYLLGNPVLSGSLFLSLLAYYLDAGSWRSFAEGYLARQERAAALQPYRLWAARHPLTYDDVAANPSAWAGRAVLWEIGLGRDGGPCYQGDVEKKILWSEGAAAAGLPAAGPFPKVLARVEISENALPVLAFLGVF